ncbi:MAG: hypothetical protein ACNA8W_08720 [Bradymonadaceae bacterium]
MSFEKILASLAGYDEMTRVEVSQVTEPGETPTLEMRLQTHGGELGWLTTKRIRLASGQIRELRDALNMMDLDAQKARPSARTGNAASNVIALPLVRSS